MSPFPKPLLEAELIRRYRRFLADVRFDDGTQQTVHCADPGAMTGLDVPGSRILLSDRLHPRRKLRYTWELVRVGRSWVCVNTTVANRVVGRWLETGRLDLGAALVRREVRHRDVRFDFALDDGSLVEVKTVTLRRGRWGCFPDSVTARGRRHLERLAALRGRRRVLLYFVARGDVAAVRPADDVDPAYGRALRAAAAAGVEIRAVRAHFSREGVRRGPFLEVDLS